MALIATVNGTPVYSDKQMTGIINSQITFSDGSWCDVSTGGVHNNGAGYIRIGGSENPSDSKNITEGPKQVSASVLELRGVVADVQVDVHDFRYIEYTVTGPAERVKAIRAKIHGDTLVFEGGDTDSSGGGRTIIQNGRSRTIVSGGSVVIGSGSVMSSIFGRNGVTTVITNGGNENDVQITIKVPPGTAVYSNRVLGNVTIGNTNGPLTASVQGQNSVTAGRISSAHLTVQGSGDIEISEVNGPVVAHVQGSGGVKIKDGAITTLTVSVQGSGDLKIGGSAITANLSVQGSGDIRVAHVQQRPVKNVMGSGSIKVGSVG